MMKRRTWPRRLLVTAAVLVAAAVVTVAVAWVCSVNGPAKVSVTMAPEDAGGRRPADVAAVDLVWNSEVSPEHRGFTRSVGRGTALGIRDVVIYEQSPLYENWGRFTDRAAIVRHAGWPWPALGYVLYGPPGNLGGARGCVFLNAAELAATRARTGKTRPNLKRILPLTPEPAGFALDTAVYAAAIGVPVLVIPAVRRWRRRRRGACSACGYDLAGSPPTSPCPECGAARG